VPSGIEPSGAESSGIEPSGTEPSVTDNPAQSSPLAPGARILVTGAGITGRAVVSALSSWDLEMLVCDDDVVALQALTGADTISPADAIDRAAQFDLVVTSPGFPPTAPVLAAAAASTGAVGGKPGLVTTRSNCAARSIASAGLMVSAPVSACSATTSSSHTSISRSHDDSALTTARPVIPAPVTRIRAPGARGED